MANADGAKVQVVAEVAPSSDKTMHCRKHSVEESEGTFFQCTRSTKISRSLPLTHMESFKTITFEYVTDIVV